MTDTDWIKPNAPVLIFREGAQAARTAKKTTIARVAKQSFTVQEQETRFRIADARSKAQGASWSQWTYKCVPLGSVEARGVLEARRELYLRIAARRACEAWMRDESEEHRTAAVDALTKLAEFGPRPTTDGD